MTVVAMFVLIYVYLLFKTRNLNYFKYTFDFIWTLLEEKIVNGAGFVFYLNYMFLWWEEKGSKPQWTELNN